MKYRQLPKDIRNHIAKKVVLRLLKFLLLVAVAVCLNLLLYKEFIEKTHMVVYIVFLCITVFLPFPIAGVPAKLIDSSWQGVVKEVDIREETGSYAVGGVRSFPYTKHVIYLTVETDNGKIRQAKAKEYAVRSHTGFSVPSEGDIQLHMNDYHEGDIIYHFYGLSELFVISQNQSTTVNCVVCGSQNPTQARICHHCGHSLLHISLDHHSQSNGGQSS